MAKWVEATVMLLLVAVAVAVTVVVAAPSPPLPECDLRKLAACAGPIFFGLVPSKSCCSNLRAQEGCFCQYARDPVYASYINNTNSHKTIAASGIAFPNC